MKRNYRQEQDYLEDAGDAHLVGAYADQDIQDVLGQGESECSRGALSHRKDDLGPKSQKDE